VKINVNKDVKRNVKRVVKVDVNQSVKGPDRNDGPMATKSGC
jgi:hypothetical protein